MNVSESPPALVQASQTGDCFKAALAYHQQGLSILPLKGKRPALSSWTEFQSRIATEDEIKQWQRDDLLQNVGVVCGKVSNNLVVIDFDGLAAYSAFTTLFPALAETFTARTGSSQGMHVYLYVDTLPATTKAMDTPIGNIELRANGSQVVASPSLHPVTRKAYQVKQALDIRRVPDLAEVAAWIERFKFSKPKKTSW